MSSDLFDPDVKQVRSWHYLVALAASSLVTCTSTQTILRDGIQHENSRTYYLGFVAVAFWAMKAFDLNPGRSLARGKWVLLVGLLGCLARNALST
jgi:hypothetical protein